MRRVGLAIVCAAWFAAGMACPARGQVIVATNFGGPPRTGPSASAYQAQSFTTGPVNLTLSKISAIFQVPASALSVDMALYDDNAGKPGSLVFDLGTKAISTTIAQNDWTSPGAFTLAASTTYWAVAYESNAANTWFSTNVFQTGGVGVLGGAQTSTDGNTWTSFRQALLIQVEGTAITAVPESGPLASGSLVAILAGSVAAWRRRT